MRKGFLFLIAALAVVGLSITSIVVALKPSAGNQAEAVASDLRELNCQNSTLAEEETGDLTILANQATNEEEVCLFVGCSSFF